MRSVDERSPNSKPSESITIVFPAPVSPVSRVSPDPSSISRELMSAMLLILSNLIIAGPLPGEDTTGPRGL